MIIFKTLDFNDYPSIAHIYEEGIQTGNATFQTHATTWEAWDKSHLPHSRLVATADGVVLGWAALSPVSSRCIYNGVAEVSIYIAAAARGQGIGKLLLRELVQSSEQHQIWMLQSGIFPENHASIRIHEQTGFRIVGFREKIGKMKQTWRDNLLLEKRSKIIGIH